MSDLEASEGLTGGEHIHPVFCTDIQSRSMDGLPGLYRSLIYLLWPWHKLDYPGRTAALANALGYTSGTIGESLKRRLSVPRCLRAEKFCRDMIRELDALACQFRDEAERLERAKAGKSRGFLDVRVREPGGIPRTAIHSQHRHTHYAHIPNPRRAGKGAKNNPPSTHKPKF